MILKRPNNFAEGFTLMEILAALLLTGLILPVAMNGVSMANMLASDSARKYEAADLAQAKMSEILLEEDWKNGSSSGEFENQYEQYEWISSVSDWTTSGLKQIELTVFWNQRGRTNKIVLSTLIYANE